MGFKYQLWCYSCFYMDALLRSGKCREEKTWGKTENGSEEPHQINRGMENKVSHGVTWCDSLVPLLTVLMIACLLSCPTKHAFPSVALEKECCTWPKVWFKFLLWLLLSLVWSVALQHPPQDKMHNCSCVTGVWYHLVWTRIVKCCVCGWMCLLLFYLSALSHIHSILRF